MAAANYNNANTMYVFTGTSSPLLSLDTNSWEWTLTPGPARDSNNLAATMVASENLLIVYGGVQFNSDGTPDTSKVSDEVYVYDLASRKWMLRPNGNKVYFHSSCVAPGQAEELTFGGATTNGDLASTVTALSTTAFQFYLNRPSSQTPPQLIGTTLSCIGTSGILIGGGSLDWKATSSMVQVINNAGGDNPIFSWSQPNIKNGDSSPGARIGHSAATFGTDIYVYGGVGEKDTNVYKLNTLSWEWDVLRPAAMSSDGSTTSKGSEVSPIVIIAIVGALFGILTMGIIIAVFLRHWRQKKHNNRPMSVNGSSVRAPIQTRAWTENKNDSSVRHSFYSSSNTPSSEIIPPLALQSSLPFSSLRRAVDSDNDVECLTVAETTHSMLSGHDDNGSLAPVKYVRPLSPLNSPKNSHRAVFSGNYPYDPSSLNQHIDPPHEVSSSYPDSSISHPYLIPIPSEDFNILRSSSDFASPLDHISQLQPSVNHFSDRSQDFPIPPSELSTPSSSIQNWPFVSKVVSPFLDVPRSPLNYNHSPQTANSISSLPSLLPHTLDSILQKKLVDKYRILASSLTQSRGKVSLIQATEVATLDPVTIVVYQDKASWVKESEMLEILEGPFSPKLKEVFTISSQREYFILVHERMGMLLPDILRRQNQPFSDTDTRALIKGITTVLDFCHSRGVVLADLQPADFAFASDSSSRLMLSRTDSCLIEGDVYQCHQLPRYCPPEIALTFLNESDSCARALPSIDSWALGCFIYELYARKPALGNQHSDNEILQFLTHSSKSKKSLSSGVQWKDGILILPEIESLPEEATQAINVLLRYNSADRATASQILGLSLLKKCSSQFSLLATLPNPLLACYQTGEVNQHTATAIIALRRQVVATSEIIAPRLVIIIPTYKASLSWKDPSSWDSDSFLVFFLCEGAHGLHFTRQSGIPLSNPHDFLARTGLFIAIVAQLCALYLSPELLGELDSSIVQYLFTNYNSCDLYFQQLAQLLEHYSSGVNEKSVVEASQELETARRPEALGSWISDWILAARSALTSTRHIALQEVRDFLGPDYPLDLVYTRSSGHVPTASAAPQPKWLSWLCPAHASLP